MDNYENKLVPNKKISDLRPGDKNVDVKIILVNRGTQRKLKSDVKITQFQVSDQSGSILCNFFDETGSGLSEGDILFLKTAYASIFKNQMILYTSKPGYGQVIKLGEFFMTFSDTPNMSLIPWKKERDDKTGQEKFVIDEEELQQPV